MPGPCGRGPFGTQTPVAESPWGSGCTAPDNHSVHGKGRIVKKMGKRGWILLALLLVGAVAAVGGYAYWTSTGTGSASATNASSNGTIALNGSFAGGLAPGGSKTITFTADNAGTSSLRVGTIHAVVSIDAPHVALGCLASDFTVADVVQNQTVPASTSGFALPVNGSIVFADTASNQDGCKGATVTLTLSS